MSNVTATSPTDAGRYSPPSNGAGSNGSRNGPPLPLAPARSVRSRVPQALLAALLIVGGALGGLLAFNRYDERVPAVVVAAPVAHGQTLTRADLAVAEVALDDGVASIRSIDELVGRVAAHDLRRGELVTAGDVTTEDRLVRTDESVIGLLLEPGRYPTRGLSPGDRVDVFAPGGETPSALTGPVASDLVVHEVVESSSDGRLLLVSVVVGRDEAADVLDAVAARGVTLSLRGAG